MGFGLKWSVKEHYPHALLLPGLVCMIVVQNQWHAHGAIENSLVRVVVSACRPSRPRERLACRLSIGLA